MDETKTEAPLMLEIVMLVNIIVLLRYMVIKNTPKEYNGIVVIPQYVT